MYIFNICMCVYLMLRYFLTCINKISALYMYLGYLFYDPLVHGHCSKMLFLSDLYIFCITYYLYRELVYASFVVAY